MEKDFDCSIYCQYCKYYYSYYDNTGKCSYCDCLSNFDGKINEDELLDEEVKIFNEIMEQ